MHTHNARSGFSPFIFASAAILLLLTLSWSQAALAHDPTDKPDLRPQPSPKAAKKTAKSDDDTVTGWVFIADMAGSFNNPGVRLIGRFGYQWRMYKHDHLAFANNFIRLNLISQATPANLGGGANISIQPASFFRVGVNYSIRGFLPAFTVGTTFRSEKELVDRFTGTTDFLDGEARLNDQRDLSIKRNGGRVGLYAHIFRVHWLLQLRLFGFVAQFLGSVAFFYPQYNDVDNAPLIYEAGSDLVIRNVDQIFNALIVAGYEWQNLRFLLVNTYTVAIQSKEEIWGIGPGLQWTVTPQWRFMRKPFFLFVVRWWARHRFRTGPMPNLAVIFQTEFDI